MAIPAFMVLLLAWGVKDYRHSQQVGVLEKFLHGDDLDRGGRPRGLG
jgi:hypothetical protein